MVKTADTIISNARIFTSDAHRAWAEALAISGKRIVEVGSAEDMEPWRGETTRLIDGHGCTLTPGFIDSHFH
jgi:predicted amidohydrolase YtcJ